MPVVSCLRQLGVCYEFMVGQHSISSPRSFKMFCTEFSIAGLALTDQSNDLKSSFSFFPRWSYRERGKGQREKGGKDLGIILVLPPFPLLIPDCRDATRHQVLLHLPTRVPLQSFPVCHLCVPSQFKSPSLLSGTAEITTYLVFLPHSFPSIVHAP